MAAILDYSTTSLVLKTVSVNSAVWDTTAKSTGGAGVVDVEVGTTKPVLGDYVVAVVRFHLFGGTLGAMSFDKESAVVSAKDWCNRHPVPAVRGSSVTLQGSSPVGVAVSASSPAIGSFPNVKMS